MEPARSDCEGLCWNLATWRLGEQPHAGSYSAGQFSSSFGSFTQPCTQWLHKADYKLQRIPEGAKSDAGANEPREPLIPVTEWDKLGKAWTTQIQAHQAAESLPWEPGVIIRPIQRGPGTLGAREASLRRSASARLWEWRPRLAPPRGWGAEPRCVRFGRQRPRSHRLVNTTRDTGGKGVQEATRAWVVRNVSSSRVRRHCPAPSPAWSDRSPLVTQANDPAPRVTLCLFSPQCAFPIHSRGRQGPRGAIRRGALGATVIRRQDPGAVGHTASLSKLARRGRAPTPSLRV